MQTDSKKKKIPFKNYGKGVKPVFIEGIKIVNGNHLPLVLSPTDTINKPEELLYYVKKEKETLLQLLNINGAILLRGWGKSTPKIFSDIANEFNMNNNFDMSCSAGPRLEVSPGVFTANEAPPSDSIPFHHEMAQCEKPPAIVIFFCVTPTKVGGRTPLISSNLVAEYFLDKFPESAKKILLKKVRYVRILPEITDTRNALGKSWKVTYNVETKKEAENKMKLEETEWEWLPKGFLKTISKQMDTIIKNQKEEKVFFAAAETTFKSGSNDTKLDIPSKKICFGDGSELDEETLHSLIELGNFMEQMKTNWKWESGDVLIIDNSSVMHSREYFEPPRRILASLIGRLHKQQNLKRTF